MEIAEYLAVVLLVVAAVTVGLAILALGTLIGVDNPTREKKLAFEAGSDPLGKPQEHRFDVKYYMVALSFVLFDLETVFVIPWAISWNMSKDLGHGFYSLLVMFVFVTVLTLGLVYEWKQGGLEWD